ncbi:MAG: acetyl/propionyl/methylcrotonyl-CoA carboxylase subunit alpha [Gammaproteobacteria bacterium]|nr:acetyl/propionyl/methylcrotonyl-CoA carboxylase subunit alpha [Gammaproteobacteria bacterium]
MFSKILIANRGEIAVRVARTARRFGIVSVAVYSTADRQALHVEACDEAFCIGGASASESYLNATRILEVARQCGAEAIHPGYGFLSENADFARACDAAGIVFIGPPASAIDAMGSKSEAKALMDAAGVPLIPGYHGDEQEDDFLAEESRRIGYPQLIKASAGGGGKGMRLVERESEFAAALVSARREARAAFGDDKVLIERYLRRPRHVEMQIFADSLGNSVHLFERDCSIQRRHQKILEEAPAPGLDDSLRAQMGDAAVNCARAIDYVGAGTVEFLLDEDGRFYFMEMNTRLQVEHPVTEMITRQDLVEWQLRVASGESLPLQQAQIEMHGHAFEARIYAESPQRDFMPAAGQISFLQLPELSDEVRVDTGVRCGDTIGTNYDPMIAKLVAHGRDRDTALSRLAHALRQYQILGPGTNLDFLGALVAIPEFLRADFDTGFIGRHHQQLFAQDSLKLRRALVLAAAAMLPAFAAPAPSGDYSPWQLRNHWRMNLASVERIKLAQAGDQHEVLVEQRNDGWHFVCAGQDHRLSGNWINRRRMCVDIDGERIELAVVREPGSISLAFQGQSFQFELAVAMHDAEGNASGAGHPQAPMSGAVVAVVVAPGDRVEVGDPLMVIEAMKMEHTIVAQAVATVDEVLFAVGDQVEDGDTLVNLEVE